MINSLMNTKPFTMNVGLFGDLEIGNGVVKMEVPFTDKCITLNSDDIVRFRRMFM